jgi:hypothetical protein
LYIISRLGSSGERRKESKEKKKKLREEGISFPVKNPNPKLGKKNKDKSENTTKVDAPTEESIAGL